MARSGKAEAEGSLTVMEAWAEEENEAQVDAMLDAEPGVYYIKEKPTPEDNTPVKLKNRWFASVFELIGSMYALPMGSAYIEPISSKTLANQRFFNLTGVLSSGVGFSLM